MIRQTVWTLGIWALVLGIPTGGHAADEARMLQLEQQLQTMQKAMTSMQTELQSLRSAHKQEREQEQEQTRRRDVLAEEVDKLRTSLTLPDFTPLSMEDRKYGLGPAASKVYGVAQGLSIGGYGEAYYRKDVSDKTRSDRDTTDYLRFVLYTGYKFSDRIILNAELEFEHASTSTGGSVSVEFAYLDFLMYEWANFRAGMLLAPMGIVNELHEPVFFNGVERPEVERRIIPSTWRENGVGIFGELLPGLEYRVYGMNALKGVSESSGGASLNFKEHYRSTRQKGGEALAEDIAFVARLDYSPILNATFGGSVYTGKSSHDQQYVDDSGSKVDYPDARLTIWELHALYSLRGLEARALFAMSHLNDTDELNRIGGKRQDRQGDVRLLHRAGLRRHALGCWGLPNSKCRPLCVSPILTSTPRWPATGTPRVGTSTASGPPASAINPTRTWCSRWIIAILTPWITTTSAKTR